MGSRYLLEISTESTEAAAAAERGGADRIELCAKLSVGGLTPSGDLMGATRERVRLPIFAMIRPRAGDFVYSQAEFEGMRDDIETARRTGIDGVVLGILRKNGCVDVERTRRLVERARPLAVTFHRAFDECAELHESLEDVIHTGADRILTSGGAPTALEGAATIAKLVAAAGDRITIIPGSGLNSSNIARVAQQTRAREYHSGLSSVLAVRSRNSARFESEVGKVAAELAGVGKPEKKRAQ